MRPIRTLLMPAILLAAGGPVRAEAPAGHPGIMLGAFIPAVNGDGKYRESIKAFDDATGKRHTHVMMYCNFTFDIDAYPHLVRQIVDAGKVPIITWQSGNEMGGADPRYSNESFVRGAHDAVIDKMAERCAELRETIYMRWAHEMNIRSAPAWPGHEWNRESPDDFIQMWRHVHARFRNKKATNVKWIWSVNYESSPEWFSDYNVLYPGDDYVDMIGVSGLNYGNHPNAGPRFPVTVQWLYLPPMRDLMAGSYAAEDAARTHRRLAALGGGKPQGSFSIGTVGAPWETTVPGGSTSSIPKADWILQGYDALAHMEEFGFVRLLVWYNDIATSGGIPSDFRAARNPGRSEPPVPPHITEAYARAISDPVFIEEELSFEDMDPGPFREASSLVTPADYPQHEFMLDVRRGGTVRAGGSVSGAYFLVPAIDTGPLNWDTDAYIVARLPNGEYYAFIPPAAWRRFDPNLGPPPPTVRRFSVKRPSRGMAFAQRLGAGLPGGEYTVYSVLVKPGTDPREPGQPDLRTTAFTLSD
ncbi:MAG: glycosyl hydrolase [bacterium]|nr:glycosyl hydrolase [bacterium]